MEKEFIKAAKNGDTAQLKNLLATNPELINARDKDDSTALHYASWKGHEDAVAYLLESGADVNAQNKNGHWGSTPLHAAAHGNQAPVAELLIAHGANVNAPDSGGNTPLFHTAIHNAKRVAKILEVHGGTK